MPPDAHPAHALLAAAHALLSPATAIAQRLCPAALGARDTNITITKQDTDIKTEEQTEKEEEKSETLLLEGTKMPDNNVDLMDVVEAINRLCENMSTSYEAPEVHEEPAEGKVEPIEQREWEESIDWTKCEQETVVESDGPVEFLMCKPRDSFFDEVLSSVQKIPLERVQCSSIGEVETGDVHAQMVLEVTTPNEELDVRANITVDQNESTESLPYQSMEMEPVKRVEGAERWSDSASFISLPGQAEDVTSIPNAEPVSEMYYTASSEVSLLSDLETTEMKDERERKGVIAGHVAAMRERFESMTRANTPCPDAARSLSPSLDVRNITPSPDLLG